jgi:hypothetical protein
MSELEGLICFVAGEAHANLLSSKCRTIPSREYSKPSTFACRSSGALAVPCVRLPLGATPEKPPTEPKHLHLSITLFRLNGLYYVVQHFARKTSEHQVLRRHIFVVGSSSGHAMLVTLTCTSRHALDILQP